MDTNNKVLKAWGRGGGREAVNGGKKKKQKNPGNLTTSVTFIYFHVHISKGQWQTGTKTKPVNWNIITDQNENFLVEVLGLGPCSYAYIPLVYTGLKNRATETRHRRCLPLLML